MSPTSTPSEIARIALDLVAAKDSSTFAGLIAAERVAQDMQSITQGKSDFESLRREALNLATRSIFRNLGELDEGSRQVSAESIDGARATCTITGTRKGTPGTRQLFLVREQGMWKLVPSHR
jgi:hypothetical protein